MEAKRLMRCPRCKEEMRMEFKHDSTTSVRYTCEHCEPTIPMYPWRAHEKPKAKDD